MTWFLALAVPISFATLPPPRAQGEPMLAIRGLDPVALLAGKEVSGDPACSQQVGKFLYQFASDDSRKVFEENPTRYEIQLGGACGRMGLLTGIGDPDRFLVHDGKIYIFASESCRGSFAKNPGLYIDAKAQSPEGTPEESAKAQAILSKAVAAVGGAERLSALRSLRLETRETYGSGANATTGSRLITMQFPAGYRVEEVWGQSKYADSTDGAAGTRFGSPDYPMDAVEITEMELRLHRRPIAILRASVTPAAELAAYARGVEKRGTRVLDRVDVWLRGAESTLLIDRETGQIAESRWPDRKLGRTIERTTRYADFREVKGLMLPFELESLDDGKPLVQPKVEVVGYTVDPSDVTEGYFLRN